jgi:ABC-type nitrate/sulfonate/bicarbonate transport system substrate-binding protein
VNGNVTSAILPRRVVAAIGVVALAVGLVACSSEDKPAASSGESGAVEDFTVVTSNNGVQWTPIAAMAKDGVAAKHGLNVKLQVFQGGSGNSSVIFTGGTGDALMGGMDAPVNFLLKDAVDVSVVGAIEKENPWVLVAKKGSPYTSVDSLKGQTVGVSGAGSFSDYSVRYLLSKNGMTPADIKTAALGAGPAQIAGLTGGTAAAVMLQSPAFEQQQSDDAIQIVHNFREDGPMPAIVAIGRTDEVTKDPEKYTKFLAAWKEELEKMKADPDYAVKAASEYLGEGVEPSDVKIQVDAFLGGIWSTDGLFTQDLYDAGKSLLVSTGSFQEANFPSYADMTKGAPSS